MDATTSKNLISRIRQSELDEEEQEEAIRMVQRERVKALPEATVMVRGPEEKDEMGGAARLTLGEATTVGVRDEDENTVSVDLELTQLGDEIARGDGEGGPPGSDEWILADYDLTYGQAKYLLELLKPLDEDIRVGTPGDVENELRRLFGNPEDLNRWIDDLQENGVRGWRDL